MIIEKVPLKFQPKYISKYPCYSSGKNMEEILFEYFQKIYHQINTNLIYIPIFWTSLYVTRNYGTNINDVYDFLENLDNTKKYFTIVQYASGIFIKKLINIDIIVFSAGGGGINIKNNCEKKVSFSGFNRVIFCGKKGVYDIPLICKPYIEPISIKKNILCSFMGRFDTHPCREQMRKILTNKKDFVLSKSTNYTTYNKILSQSVFSLCPRGFGYTSFRIYESLRCLCIPIYIWEDKKILPFSDMINWEDICIIVHAVDINKIPDIITSMNDDIIYKMQNKIKEFNKFLTFEFIYNYILKIIK